MKQRYKISIWVALALAGSLLWGGSVWFWLAGICAGKFLIRLLLTITLAIAVYILSYALIIGAILWLLISKTDRYMKRRSKTIAQQCRYYEVDNIFEYMVSVYLNGNISAFGELYKELNRKDKKEFILYLFSEVEPIHIQEIILTTI